MQTVGKISLGILLLAWVSSCAVLPSQRPQPGHTPGPELDAGLLYEILVAEIAYEGRNYAVAAAEYLKLAKSTADARFAENATRSAILDEDLETADAATKQWIELAPTDVRAREIALSIYVRSGREDEALQQLDELLRLYSPDTEKSITMLITLLTTEPDQIAVLNMLKRYTTQHPDEIEVLYAYGYFAMRTSRPSIAIQAMDHVLKVQPDSERALVVKAQILLLENDVDGALAFLDTAVDRLPDSVRLHLAYARALVRKEKFDEAWQQFHKASELDPDNLESKLAMGILSLELDRIDEARTILVPLTMREGVDQAARFYMGRLEVGQGKIDEAVKWYRQVTEGEHYFDAQRQIAIALSKEGELDAARAQLHSIKNTTAAQQVELYIDESNFLTDADRSKEAYSVLTRALDEFVDNTKLLYQRAMVAVNLNRIDDLERDLRRLLKIEPDNAHAWNALGYTIADRTTRYQEALRYIRRAMNLKPDDHFILDSYGWVQYRLKNYDTAITYLRRALDERDDAEIAAHLGEVLWVSGKTDEARKIWNAALEKSPDNKVLLETIDRLSK